MKTYQYFAANAWHDPSSGSYFDSENPATGEVWAKLPDCNAEDVNRAVAAARSAYYDGPWGKLHPAERGRVLRRIVAYWWHGPCVNARRTLLKGPEVRQ